MPQLLALAKHPNIAVKATGGPSYASDAYPFRSLHKPYRAHLRRVRAAGACSGAPTSRACPAPGGSASRISPSCPGCPAADRELIMGRAICDWIGWKI